MDLLTDFRLVLFVHARCLVQLADVAALGGQTGDVPIRRGVQSRHWVANAGEEVLGSRLAADKSDAVVADQDDLGE